jgi:hypothetical protein
MFESGDKELNVALKAESMTTDKTLAKFKGNDSVDKNMDEEENAKEHMKRFNPIDGLWHYDNGSVADASGAPV